MLSCTLFFLIINTITNKATKLLSVVVVDKNDIIAIIGPYIIFR